MIEVLAVCDQCLAQVRLNGERSDTSRANWLLPLPKGWFQVSRAGGEPDGWMHLCSADCLRAVAEGA